MLDTINAFKIRTTDNTLTAVVQRIRDTKSKNEPTKTRAIEKVTAFYKNDPNYFKLYIRLFGTQKKNTINNGSLNGYKKRLGLSNKYTQNNVNLAYTKKSDENLPMPKSPKTQRALNEAYAKITKHIQQKSKTEKRNQSIVKV